MRYLLVAVALMFITLALKPCTALSAEGDSVASPRQRIFKHSAVIAFGRGSLENYRDYGVTFVAWGGYPRADARSMDAYRKSIQDAFAVGTRIGSKIGVRTDFRGFIDFAPDSFLQSRCIKVDGTPIIVPDMLTRQYKGHPAYWFCSNSPEFRAYLKRNIGTAMQCKPFGAFMDDPYGAAAAASWFGGCYCKHCLAGFREYLKKNYTPEELKAKGIDDIDRFNLREFHQKYAELPPSKRPLRTEIIEFQSKKSAEMFRQVMAHALKVRGERIPISGNINPSSSVSGRLFIECDYFCCECGMNAKSGTLDGGHGPMAFKMADALGRPVSVMGSGGDHAFLEANHLPGMLRCRVAEAFAFGQHFAAPYRLWAYTKEKGSHNYRPRDKSEIVPLYRFIKQQAQLLDGHELAARVGVIDSYALYRRKPHVLRRVVDELVERNVPFNLLIAGDGYLPLHLDDKKLARYDTLLVPPDSVLSKADTAILARFKSEGGKVVEKVDELDNHPTVLQVTGAEKVIATLRATGTATDRSVVVHLLNRDYDLATDSCRVKSNFVLRVPRLLLDGFAPKRADYVRSPKWEPKTAADGIRAVADVADVVLPIGGTDRYIDVTIPRLDSWGIVVLRE